MKHCVLALALSFLGMPTLHASEARLTSLSFNGSGCPVPDSNSLPYGFDGQWLTVDFAKDNSSLFVNKGRDTSLEESRRNCALTLNLQLPRDQRFALERVVAWGQFDLSGGDQFTFDLSNFFQGQSSTGDLEVSAQGPSGWQNYTFDRTIGGSSLNWSACGANRALTLNSSIRVAQRNRQGDRETFSQGKLDKVAFKIVVQKCR